MTKRRTAKTPPAPRIVAAGDGWRIEFDPQSRDYAAIDDAAGLLGYRPSETAARTLIGDYRTGK